MSLPTDWVPVDTTVDDLERVLTNALERADALDALHLALTDQSVAAALAAAHHHALTLERLQR